MMPTHDAFTFDVYDDTYDALPILRDELCQSKTTTSNERATSRSATEQQRADAVACKMNFVVVFYVLNLGLLFHRRA